MGSGDPDVARRRRPARVGDLLPEAARQLGLEDELRLARAIATWDAIVAERVPPAAGHCRLDRVEPDAIVVVADEPIVAAELRMRAIELLAAFAAAPGGLEPASCASGSRPEGLPGRAGAPAYNPVSRRRADGIPSSRHRCRSTRVAPTMRLVSWPSASS